MRIAYVTPYDAHDPNAWSGAGYQIPKALAEAGAEVIYIGGLRKRPSPPAFTRAVYARLAGNVHQLEREPSVVRRYSAQAQQRLKDLAVDAILSPGSIALTYLQTTVPKVVWTDATFSGLIDYYPEFRKMTGRNRRDGDALERTALRSCALSVFSSDWAAESAVRLYSLNPERVKVIPFGSNFTSGLDESNIRELTTRRLSSPQVRLLFIGLAWARKRGDFALAVTRELRARGIDAQLDIVGSNPGAGESWATEYGFLSKSNPKDAETIQRCFSEAAFLIHPAVAECNANVFSEACSFGLPILANRTGGIPTSVRPGENGHLFETGDSPEQWADFIEQTLQDQSRYTALCMGAFGQFSTRLRWSVAGATMLRSIEALIHRTPERIASDLCALPNLRDEEGWLNLQR
ncbi:glycosyltransferase family 4 protein [Paraburkholderia xenovorans]|uniref:glycosyltransferase family 4 protein n=1 Tax=Paraburkholderia xenovorans TaxID=36873 RepID=UPI0038BBF729